VATWSLRWRTQASEWLRADLADWSKAHPVATRNNLRQRLTQWHADLDLAGLREAVELEKLPPDERKNFFTFWEGVRVVLKRAEESR